MLHDKIKGKVKWPMKSDKASTAITQQMIHNLKDLELRLRNSRGNVGQTFVLCNEAGNEHPVPYGTPWASPNFTIG